MKRLTINEMQKIAKSRGGKCLSNIYVDTKTKLLWECANGHRWKAAPNNVKTGTWCPICAGKHLTIEDMREIVKAKGGKCLSDRYINDRKKLLWECAKGHQWMALPSNVKRGSWCPVCAGVVKGTIKEMQNIAKARAGKCLSKNYINNRRKLLWECKNSHKWKASPSKIKQGQWCPLCSAGIGERITREFFEQIFTEKFPKCYPKWLINNRGNQMELDGYCYELGLAFEHHGQQHYKLNRQFTIAKSQFKQRQEDGQLKRELCTENNVTLIEIPEIPSLLPVDEVKQYIKNECQNKNFPFPQNFDSKTINLKRAYANSGLIEALKELKSLAAERGGKCLSHTYVHSHRKLLWECAEVHRWETTPTNVKNGSWCPFLFW